MSTSAFKRRRTDADLGWEACRQWAVAKGGAVHGVACSNGGLVATDSIAAPALAGEQCSAPPLLSIPLACCISASSCQKYPAGLAAARAANAAAAAGVEWTFGSESDTILAAFIGADAGSHAASSRTRSTRRTPEEVPVQHAAGAAGAPPPPPECAPYYRTLPMNAAFDTLPRRWPDEEMGA